MSLLKESLEFLKENVHRYTVNELAELTGESKKDIYNNIYRLKLDNESRINKRDK